MFSFLPPQMYQSISFTLSSIGFPKDGTFSSASPLIIFCKLFKKINNVGQRKKTKIQPQKNYY